MTVHGTIFPYFCQAKTAYFHKMTFKSTKKMTISCHIYKHDRVKISNSPTYNIIKLLTL